MRNPKHCGNQQLEWKNFEVEQKNLQTRLSRESKASSRNGKTICGSNKKQMTANLHTGAQTGRLMMDTLIKEETSE
jgi:hypothetical protein